ncbi:MAG: hypothetical protein RL594_1302 [Bacteroidota bacterium]|jgi:aspartate kinase
MLVLKFGGTSVADEGAMRQVAEIVATHGGEPDGIVVVLSATSGTTTQLLNIAQLAGSGQAFQEALDNVIARHLHLAQTLVGSTSCIDELCNDCHNYAQAVSELGEWNGATLDGMACFGELLSSTILHQFLCSIGLNSHLVDARSLIATNDDAQHAVVDIDRTTQNCLQSLRSAASLGRINVTQGFIARGYSGRTTTLGRGGSDYSAAIIGACLGAREIQIYTDVSGVYTADPRLVESAHPIAELSFSEMRDMASYGAKVLHPDTIIPAVHASIPVRVLNTFRPADSGTLISNSVRAEPNIRSVSLVRDIVVISGHASIAHHLLVHAVLRSRIVYTQQSVNSSMICLHGAVDDDVHHVLQHALTGEAVEQHRACLVVVAGLSTQDLPGIVPVIDALKTQKGRPYLVPLSQHCIGCIVDAEYAESAVLAIHSCITRRQDPA